MILVSLHVVIRGRFRVLSLALVCIHVQYSDCCKVSFLGAEGSEGFSDTKQDILENGK